MEDQKKVTENRDKVRSPIIEFFEQLFDEFVHCEYEDVFRHLKQK